MIKAKEENNISLLIVTTLNFQIMAFFLNDSCYFLLATIRIIRVLSDLIK